MPADLRHRRWWIVLGWALILAVLYFSLTPQPPPAGLQVHDKLGHFLAYAALMAWWQQIERDAWRLALLLVLLGLCIELLQSQTGYRQGDIFDLAANTAGIGCGWLLTRLSQDWLARCERLLPR